MYVAEMDATIEDLRVMAMHQRSPINSFMFSNKGVLLDANASALQACHAHTPGECSAGFIAHQLCLSSMLLKNWLVLQVVHPVRQSTSRLCLTWDSIQVS